MFSRSATSRRLLVVLAVLTLLAGFLALQTAVPASAQPTDELVGVAPFRAADTRNGTGGRWGALGWGDSMAVKITGPGVPSGAKAASLNVTVVEPQAAGFVTAYPCGRSRPLASNLNFTPGQVIANAVISGVGTGDTVCFYSSVPTHLVVDVNGYLPVASTYQAVTPYRATDTRITQTGPMLAGQLGRKMVAPAGEWAAAALNVTVVDPTEAGFITVYPCGGARPTASNLNFVPGQTVPNAVVTGVGADGNVCFYTSAKTHLVVDVVGYFPKGAKFTADAPKRVLDTRATWGLVGAGETFSQQVVQPGAAVAVSMNVTVTETRGSGFLTVYPCSVGRPLASNLNFTAGQTIPNMVWSQVDSQGRICVYTSQTTHLVIDVTGTFSNISPPGPVTALTVGERTGNSIALSWTNPSDLDLAEVAVRRAAGSVPPASRWSGSEVRLSSPKAVSVTDTGLTSGSPYAYAIFTTDSAGNENSVPATVATSTRDVTPPGKVTNLSAVATSPSSVQLNWSNPTDSDLAQVIVRRAEGWSAPWSPTEGTDVPLLWATGTTVTDNGLASGTTYSYAVFTKDTSGNMQSAPATASVTTTDGTPPGPVTGLGVTGTTSTSVDLSWTNPTDGDLAEVIVRRATGSTPPGSATSGTQVWLPWSTADYVTDTGLAPGTTYSYAVFTKDTTGNVQAAPATVSLTTADGTPPGPVTGLSLTGATPTSVDLSWTNPSDGDLAEVIVRRATGSTPPGSATSGTQVWLPWSTASSVTDTGLAPGTTYSYAVFTRDVSGNIRTAGVTVSVTTPAEQQLQQVAAGHYHSCGLDAAGQAWCWGNNDYGQVGDGTTTTRTAPAPVGGGRPFTQISAGYYHTCGLDTAGKAWCWGYNGYGQLGNNSTASVSAPVAVSGSRTFTRLDAGGYTTCAVDGAGKAWCWGYNYDGQVGNGGTSSAYTPAAVNQGATSLRSVAVGGYHACGLDTAGKAWCWGSGSDGRLGTGSTSSRYAPAPVSGGRVFAQIDAGGRSTCAVDTAGSAWCWGYNDYGQLGNGGTSSSSTPVAVSQGSTVLRSVAVGSRHACAADSAGKAWCWGYNGTGQIGTGGASSRTTPGPVSGAADYVQAAGGTSHTCARTAGSQVRCWGYNSYGQLGDGSTADRYTPVSTTMGDAVPPGPITGLAATAGTTRITLSWTNPSDPDLAEVIVRRATGSSAPGGASSGTSVSLATSKATSVADAGLSPGTTYSYAVFTRDTSGNTRSSGVAATVTTDEAGNSRTDAQAVSLPLSINGRITSGDQDWYRVTTGTTGTLNTRLSGLSADLDLYVYDGAGTELGHSTAGGSSSESVMLQSVAAGTYYVRVVPYNGAVSNYALSVSHAPAADTTPPGPVTGLQVTGSTSSSISLAWTNPTDGDLAEVLVRRATGSAPPGSAASGTGVSLATAKATSSTDTGLSPGTTYTYAVFTRDTAGNTRSSGAAVSAATPAAQQQLQQVSAGEFFSCGLDAAGKAWCWGRNDDGQVGDRSTTDRSVPVAVAGSRSFTQISAGYSHTCALDTSGQAWCWGSNSYGGLGNNSTASVSAPVAVSGSLTFTRLDAGGYGTCAVDGAGKAWCWGSNSYGQVGNGGTSSAYTPTAVSQGATLFRSVSVGSYHACGLDSAGKAWCWGYGGDGRLGYGTSSNRSTPTAVAGSRVFAQIDAGYQSTCAVDTAGMGWCWGYNGYGQLGNGGTSSASAPVAVSQGSTVLRSVAVGRSHACGVDSAGKAWCWGAGGDGRLGNGSTSTRYTPTGVSGAADYTQIAGGANHMCGRTAGGQVRCWGHNVDGQIGDGTTSSRYTPVNVSLADPLAHQQIENLRADWSFVDPGPSVTMRIQWDLGPGGTAPDSFAYRVVGNGPGAVSDSGVVAAADSGPTALQYPGLSNGDETTYAVEVTPMSGGFSVGPPATTTLVIPQGA